MAATTPARFDRSALLYASYVLFVLVLVYLFNFADRNLLPILAERIKIDLAVSDADLGFLYGTAFAIFYALFGIPLGRLADVWNRRTLIAIGLAFWSAMTALSGFSRNFGELTAARIGVGVGEASATPAAYSMLSDYFPMAWRATALAIYSSGIYLGAGFGHLIGGRVLDSWDTAFPDGGGPLGLVGWKTAFLVAGIPGLLLAVWVLTLREPRRGQADGIETPPHPHPFREFALELRAVLPPLTLWNLAARGGRRAAGLNAVCAVATALVTGLLVAWTGDTAQWVALGIGLYAAVSWAHSLSLRDLPAFALIFRAHSPRRLAASVSLLAFGGYGFGFWMPPFLIRHHGLAEGDVGDFLFWTTSLGGFLGVTLGGFLADLWRARTTSGRLRLIALTSVLPIPFAAWFLFTPSPGAALWLTFPLTLAASIWLGGGASTLQDLVLPRMRATASAAYLLVITFVGLALGPFTIGRVSMALGDLRMGMFVSLIVNVIALAFAIAAARGLPRDLATLRDRASAAGEVIS